MAITLVMALMAVITATAQNAAGADIVTHLNKQSNGKVESFSSYSTSASEMEVLQ